MILCIIVLKRLTVNMHQTASDVLMYEIDGLLYLCVESESTLYKGLHWPARNINMQHITTG